MYTLPRRRPGLKDALSIALLVLLAFYIYYQFERYLEGPVISVGGELLEATTFTEPLLTIEGRARNVAFIYINDRQIFTDERGNFEELFLLQPGYNVVSIRARDQFGRHVEKRYEVALDAREESPEDIRKKLRRAPSTEESNTATSTAPPLFE
jgi:uncharacterized protein (DUF58 family)